MDSQSGEHISELFTLPRLMSSPPELSGSNFTATRSWNIKRVNLLCRLKKKKKKKKN